MKNRFAFTLIELLVIIGVGAVLATATFLTLNNYGKSNQLNLTAQEIKAALQSAQENSRTEENGAEWGVQFINSSSSPGTYTIFSGSSYASGTVNRAYSLESGIIFLDPAVGGGKGVVFNPLSGSINAYFSVTIAVGSNVSLQKVIEITPAGRIDILSSSVLAVSSINPSTGANNGPVSSVLISGSNFWSGATAKLTKSGQTDISGSGFQVTDPQSLSGGSFNLTGAATGTWNVVVTNPDGSTSTLANGFTVMLPAPVPTSVSPTSGFAGQSVTSTSVGGAYFQNGATVALQKQGQPNISGTGFAFSGPTSLTGGSFNLVGAAVGQWNVVVTNPDSQSGSLINGFAIVYPTGTINSTYQYAWNDNIGWLQFASSSSNVTVSDSGLAGYAWNANYGNISLNCSNTGSCSSVNYGVTNTFTSATATLAGYAWNDNIGWVSFCGGQSTSSCPGTVSYGVTIDSSGDFHGYAWNDNVGWISFNCADGGSCGTIPYKVNTTWQPH